MPVGTRSAIFIQHGVPAQKQSDACLEFTTRRRWQMRHYVPYWAPEDAVSLVRTGAVQVVVAAFDSPALRQLAQEIGQAGEVMFVHPRPTIVEPVRHSLPANLGDLILRWFRRGRTVQEIAADVDSDTGDIRDILRREGEHPDRSA